MKKVLVLMFVAVSMASLVGCRGGFFDRMRNRGDACSPYAERERGGLFGCGLFNRAERQQFIAVPVTSNIVNSAPACGSDAGCGTDAGCGSDLGCGTDYAAPSCNCNHGGCANGECSLGCPHCGNSGGEIIGDSYGGEVYGGIVDGGIVGGGIMDGGPYEGQIIDGEIIGEETLPGPDFSSQTPALPTTPSESATQ